MHPRERIEFRVEALRMAGQWREPERALEDAKVAATAGVVDARSNDYLGLGARTVSRETGLQGRVGAGASRLISGTHAEHVALEGELAEWQRTEAALLFSSGYAANVGAISALAGPGETVVSDALNHASIIDGCRLSRANVVVLPHADLGALERALADIHGVCWVVTESYFGMDGDVPDLVAIRRLCDAAGAALIVDEAHAVGVFGPEGRGVCAEQDVIPDVLIGGMGKAFGAQGGFVACSRSLRGWLWNRSRSLVYSTAASPVSCALAREQLRALREGDRQRKVLAALETRLADSLRAGGIALPASRRGPIFPIVFGAEAAVMRASAMATELGVLCHPIRPPTVPRGGSRLRVSLRADMTETEVDRIASAVVSVWEAARESSPRSAEAALDPVPSETRARPAGPQGERTPASTNPHLTPSPDRGRGIAARHPAAQDGTTPTDSGNSIEGPPSSASPGSDSTKSLETLPLAADRIARAVAHSPGSELRSGAMGAHQLADERLLGAADAGLSAASSAPSITSAKPPGVVSLEPEGIELVEPHFPFAGDNAAGAATTRSPAIGAHSALASARYRRPEDAADPADDDDPRSANRSPNPATPPLTVASHDVPTLGPPRPLRPLPKDARPERNPPVRVGALAGRPVSSNAAEARDRRWLILGTGTGIGKTYAARGLVSLLARGGVPVAGLKPVETGLRDRDEPSDAALLAEASFAVPLPSTHPLYPFDEPLTPARAARAVGRRIDLQHIVAWIREVESGGPDRAQLVIETAGGVFSPLDDGVTNFDLARALDPALWVLVAPDRLGVLHDVGSCLLAMEALGRLPDYLVLSAPEHADSSTGTNREELARNPRTPPIIDLPRNDPASLRTLLTLERQSAAPL